jgi:hypothetical protein
MPGERGRGLIGRRQDRTRQADHREGLRLHEENFALTHLLVVSTSSRLVLTTRKKNLPWIIQGYCTNQDKYSLCNSGFSSGNAGMLAMVVVQVA